MLFFLVIDSDTAGVIGLEACLFKLPYLPPESYLHKLLFRSTEAEKFLMKPWSKWFRLRVLRNLAISALCLAYFASISTCFINLR
jgi:hypothetical protein